MNEVTFNISRFGSMYYRLNNQSIELIHCRCAARGPKRGEEVRVHVRGAWCAALATVGGALCRCRRRRSAPSIFLTYTQFHSTGYGSGKQTVHRPIRCREQEALA